MSATPEVCTSRQQPEAASYKLAASTRSYCQTSSVSLKLLRAGIGRRQKCIADRQADQSQLCLCLCHALVPFLDYSRTLNFSIKHIWVRLVDKKYLWKGGWSYSKLIPSTRWFLSVSVASVKAETLWLTTAGNWVEWMHSRSITLTRLRCSYPEYCSFNYRNMSPSCNTSVMAVIQNVFFFMLWPNTKVKKKMKQAHQGVANL